jgi:hypothetical protein
MATSPAVNVASGRLDPALAQERTLTSPNAQDDRNKAAPALRPFRRAGRHGLQVKIWFPPGERHMCDTVLAGSWSTSPRSHQASRVRRQADGGGLRWN